MTATESVSLDAPCQAAAPVAPEPVPPGTWRADGLPGWRGGLRRRLRRPDGPLVPHAALAVVMVGVSLLGLGIVPPRVLQGTVPWWACSLVCGGLGSTFLLGGIAVYVDCSRPERTPPAAPERRPAGSPTTRRPRVGAR